MFFDAPGSLDLAIDLLADGGILVKDDLTPGRPIEGDPVREMLFGDARLLAIEVNVAADMAVVIAVRRPGEAAGKSEATAAASPSD